MNASSDHNPHILVNALSVSSGGGFTVCRELVRGLAAARPSWRMTVVMTEGSAFHEPMRGETFPGNVAFVWAPAATASLGRRVMYENFGLVKWASENGVRAVLQLNGQVVPRLRLPTISHAQDPVPYLPRMWKSGWKAKAGAFLRRRAVRQALRRSSVMGFTSGYLRDLVLDWEKVKPARTEVFYNAVPEDWTTRDDAQMPSLASRPMEVLTVSDVTPHKRQHLIAGAVCALRKEKGFEGLTYRVVGRVFDEGYARSLREMSDGAGGVRAGSESELGRPLAYAKGSAPAVQLVGRLSGDELAAAFKSARCFAFMSVCESFGIPPLEAMSFGTPVVSSECCAMPEVLGDAAEFVPMDDGAALKDALRRVLTDRARAEEMRVKGFERFRKFRWKETVAKMAGCLDGMLGKGA